MNSQRAKIADDLVSASKILIKKGLCEAFGHVSARVPGDDAFLITPRSSLGLVVSPDNLVLVNLRGERVGGDNQQPLETWLHTCIYRRRADVGAIARTHSFTTSAFSVAGVTVKPVHDFGAIMLGETPVFSDSRLIENEELGAKLALFIGNGTAALLRGNGTAVLGKDVAEAVIRSIYLEESAILQFKAKQIGQPVYFSAEEIHQRGMQLLEPSHILRAWHYYKKSAGI